MHIANLPTDIKHCVVDYLSEGFDKSLDDFSAALPMLWICREWRLLAQDRIYSCAYLEVYRYTSQWRDLPLSYEVVSNFELICHNKLQHLVKRLGIHNYSEPDYIDMKCLVNCIIKIGNDTSIPLLRKAYYTVDILAQNTADLFNCKPEEIVDGLDVVLVRTFQNVKHIDAFFGLEQLNNSAEIDTLVAGYGKQLQSVKYACYEAGFNLSPASRLTDLDLHLRIDGDIFTFPANILTTIQHLKLDMCVPTHMCNFFSRNHDTDKTVFNNLKRLVLDGDYDSYAEAFADDLTFGTAENACTHGMSFPALVELRVSANFIIGAEIECLLQAPLRRLTYCGFSLDFINFYRKLPTTIEYLGLFFTPDDDDENLAQNLNKIFSRVQGIDVVELNICIPSYEVAQEFDTTNIKWPNLTHIMLTPAYRKPCYILDIADNAPDLLVFKYYITNYDKVENAMLDIRERYPHPSSSKIHTLTFIYDNNLENNFNDALENLKWYWPNLRNIEFQKRRP